MFKGNSVGFRKETYIVAKWVLFLKLAHIKASNTHQKARVSLSTSVQLRVNYQMVGVTRRKCESGSWGVCTESKICDTIIILNQYRAKISYSRSL